MMPGGPVVPRRILFHPLSCALFPVVREVLRCDSRFRLSHTGPLIASAATSLQRRPWVERTLAAAAAVPDDWHRALPPIFVLGFWRSGTTLMHELLAADRGFVAPSLVDVLFPADAPYLLRHKRRALGALGRLVLDPTARRPTRLVDRVEVMHWSPQEEELAVCHLGAPAFFRVSFFPRRRAELIEEALFAPPESDPRARWRAKHELFLRTMTAKYPGRRQVLKNPANCTRARDLLRLYPEALFVRIDRAREQSIPSFQKLMDMSFQAFSLQGAAAPVSRQEAETFHSRVMAELDAGWSLIDPARRLALSYDELTASPVKTVGRIYEAFGLTRSSEALARQRRFWRRRGRRWSPVGRLDP